MKEFLNTEMHTRVLLMNSSLELMRSVDLGKHSIYTHFPKDRNYEICRGTKSQGSRAEDALAESYFVQKMLVIWLQPITKFSVKVVNLETIIDLQSWCKTWPSNESRHIRARHKLLRKHSRACKSFWSRIGSQKSFTLTIPWNLAKLVKIFPGIIVRQQHTHQKQMELLRKQYAEWKKIRLRNCCNQVWMKNEGQIPWHAVSICETFKISCLIGRLRTKDVSENLLKIQSFRLVHYLSITLSLRKTSQESINLERKSYLDCLGYALYAGWIWKGDKMNADIEELETMDVSEIFSKRLNAKEVIFPQQMAILYF